MLAIVIPIAFVLLGCATSTSKIATLNDMWATAMSFRYSYSLIVDLSPTTAAKPDTTYVVELYEKNKLKGSTTVKWSQPEINVSKSTLVEFPISENEWSAYHWEDVSDIFTVKVYDQSQVTPELGETTSHYFLDPSLEAAVRIALGESTGGHVFRGEITKSDLAGLKELNSCISEIANLKGLEYCTNLSWLSLGINNISDITPLSKLTSLTELYLNNNQITDITPLAKLTNLTSVSLSDNKISDISSLVKNTGLGSGDGVDLKNNPLSARSRNVYVPQLEQRGVQVVIE